MSEMPTAQPEQKNNPVIAVGFIIIAIIFFVLIEPKVMEENGTHHEQSEEIVEKVVEEDIVNFTAGVPEGWPLFDKATKDIQELTRGQVITHGIVEDPSRENIVYFASSAYDTHYQQNLVSIYKYNTEDFNFERLYRTTYAHEGTMMLGENAIAEFQVVGYDNGHLVILIKNREVKTNPCDNFWLLGMERSDDYNLISMDLLRPYNGFEEYTLPDYQLSIINELELQKECE